MFAGNTAKINVLLFSVRINKVVIPLFYQKIIGYERDWNQTNAGKNQRRYLLARKRLIEKTKKEDGELVVVRDGKVVRIKARDLK